MSQTNDVQRIAKLEDLQRRAQDQQEDVVKLMAELLDNFADELWPAASTPLRYELDGFPGGLEYYQKAPLKDIHSGYMPDRDIRYRERPGKIYVVSKDGQRSPVKHPIGQREAFLITAPLSVVREYARQNGEEIEIELPELTQLIGAEEGGTIVMLCPRTHVQDVVEVGSRTLSDVLHWMLNPQKRQALLDDEARKSTRSN